MPPRQGASLPPPLCLTCEPQSPSQGPDGKGFTTPYAPSHRHAHDWDDDWDAAGPTTVAPTPPTKRRKKKKGYYSLSKVNINY